MKTTTFNILILWVFVMFSSSLFSQYKIEGRIVDDSHIGIPFANIYVKNHPEYRTRTDANGYFIMRLRVGAYQMVFSARGFQEKEHFFIVEEENAFLTMQLFPIKIKNLESVTIAAEERNVGRDIIMNTIEIKSKIDFNQYPYSCSVYIKARNESIATKKAKEKEEKKKNKRDEADARFDDVEELKKKQLEAVGGLNMVEVKLERNYLPPNKVREIRTGYEKRGSDKYLYYTTTAKSNFNFFQNIVYINDLSKTPIQSPISTAGILSYKYQLVEKIKRKGKPAINKIKITPRNIAASTLEGFIWIEDSTWLVKQLKFTIKKGNLYVFDQFKIHQQFSTTTDSICVLTNQEMEYSVAFRKEEFIGKTVVNYSNYDFSPSFDKRIFSNEVAVTTKEAYERDSTFWSSKRLTVLTPEEKLFIKKQDSIKNLYTKEFYLDSIDSVFNRVGFWKIVWFGIDHRNRVKKTQWTLSSIAAMIRPIYIAGPRVGPDFEFFKKWDNEHTLNTYTRADVGILNADVKGFANVEYLYNPFKQSTVGIDFVHNYGLIRSYDALTHVLLRDNFIAQTSGGIYHDFEVVNGLYLGTDLTYINRRPIPEDTRFIHWLDEALDNTEPKEFIAFNALIATIKLRYTPFQKYMREPNRKVILGSRWPTFFITYERGIPQLLDSEVDFDYLLAGIEQTFKIGTIGTSSYRISTGKFLSTKNLNPIDYKYHRRSDPLLFSNPLYSYQDIDSTLPTKNWYFESHYIHHFNGAILNKIPFMKKARITSVVGGGYLWVPEHKWTHYELFVGLERIFKFARRRLRLGAYVAFSEGNHIDRMGTAFKISLAILNERDMKFNF